MFRHGRVSGFEAFFRRVLDRFEGSHPGIRVVEETMPWDSGQQHQLYAINLEGKSPGFDVLELDTIWIAEFARAGWLEDLTPMLGAGERERFLPASIAAATYAGKIWAVPWFADSGLLYYRKDLLDKHGHRPPETWDDLVRVGRDVLAREGNPELLGFLWQGKQYEGLVCNALEYLSSNGVRVLDERGRWAMDSGRAEEALAFMASLVRGSGITPALVLAADEETTRQIFGDGNAVFQRNWPYALGIYEKEGSAVKGKVGIAPLPHFPGHESAGTLGGWHLAVGASSRHPREASLLAKYLASPEVQRQVFERVGYLPTRSAPYREDRRLALLGKVLERARPRPVTPFYMSLSDVLQTEVSAVLAGLKTPARAVRDIRAQVEPVLAER